LPEAWAAFAGLRKMTAGDAGWLAEARRIAANPLPPRQLVDLHFAIGKYFDDIADFEQAFGSYRHANELKKQHAAGYDRARATRAIDAIIERHDRGWLSEASVGANPSPRPVFIVGMPRSGTTLAEQILASHPSVFGAGELSFWGTESAKDPARSGASPIRKLADEYLQLLATYSDDALRVLDKMPENFLCLGLMHAALPNARIIHMRRNPLDTCLSNYFQNFLTAHAYASDLEDLAHYYREYLRLMTHWQHTLPAEAMLDVFYEDLIEDQETWSRKMVEFVGLPWDPVCLDFHRTERTVSTFSKWQARQRISRSSVGRWRNYERFLGPLLCLPH